MPQFMNASNREIARHCCVSHALVSSLRKKRAIVVTVEGTCDSAGLSVSSAQSQKQRLKAMEKVAKLATKREIEKRQKQLALKLDEAVKNLQEALARERVLLAKLKSVENERAEVQLSNHAELPEITGREN
jgi:hypothetical protein